MAAIVVFLQLRRSEAQSHEDALEDHALSVARIIGESARGGLLFDDRYALSEVTERGAGLPGVLYVEIARPDGSLALTGQPASAPDLAWPVPHPAKPVNQIVDDSLHVSTPVLWTDGAVIGSARVGISIAEHRAQRSRVDTLVGLFLVLLTGSGATIVWHQVQRARMRARLESSERFAALGQLSASVAHEINNPLAYILCNIDFALDKIQDGAEADKAELIQALTEARDGARRVRHIVADLRAYTRGRSADGAPARVHGAVDAALRLVRAKVEKRARIELDLDEDALLTVDEARLVQVLVNLLTNAAQALPSDRIDDHRVRLSSTNLGQHVVLRVSDTGPGVPQAERGRIFEPFFTTKPVGQGTGLGLYLCRSILQEAGGDIVLEDSSGPGASFVLTLPLGTEADASRAAQDAPRDERPLAPTRARGAPSASARGGTSSAHGGASSAHEAAAPGARPRGPAPLDAGSSAPSGGLRILVIDDDLHVGRAILRALRRDHKVVHMASGADALTLLERDPDFDVVLCDIVMPEMTGPQVYAALAVRHPALSRHMVFMTGGIVQQVTDDLPEYAARAVLEKPLDFRALGAVLHRAAGPTAHSPAPHDTEKAAG